MSDTTNYVCGFNMPGYMPESEPYVCETQEHAKQCIIDDILRAADEAESEDVAEALASLAEDVNHETGEFDTGDHGNGFSYWVMETSEPVEEN